MDRLTPTYVILDCLTGREWVGYLIIYHPGIMMPKCGGLEQVDDCEKDNMHFTLIPLQLALMQFMIQYQVLESPLL